MGGLDVILGPIILSEIHVLVFRSYLRLKFFKKMNIFKGRASPSLWLVHRYTRYNFKLTGPTRGTRRAQIPPFPVGFYPFVIRSYPSSFPTLRRWILHQSSLGPPSYALSLSRTLRR